MHAAISGALLRQARLQRDWSQEGLCRGICAVSYLSKIEQGKVEASGEILRQLFDRLSLPWYDQELEPWQALVNESYEAVFSCDRAAYRRCRPKLGTFLGRGSIGGAYRLMTVCASTGDSVMLTEVGEVSVNGRVYRCQAKPLLHAIRGLLASVPQLTV